MNRIYCAMKEKKKCTYIKELRSQETEFGMMKLYRRHMHH